MKLLMWIFCLNFFVSHGEGEGTWQVGVRMVLDNTYQTLFLKYHRNQNASLDVYLQTFLNSANLFFRDIKNPSIEFVLVGTYNMTLNESSTLLSNKRSTEENLYELHEFGIKHNFPSDDLVFLLYPYQLTEIDEFKTSFLDGFCNTRGYGFGYDDARTFSGVTMAARQFARLLGANADNIAGCKHSTYLMANNKSSPDKHTLSNCSKRNIQHKLQTINNCSCLRTDYSGPVNSTYLPSNFLNKTDICTLSHQNYTFCNQLGRKSKEAYVVGCSVACCEMGPQNTQNLYGILAPDGTTSDDCQLCLAGQCTNKTVTSSSSTAGSAVEN
uniref:Putative secreted metalloprotease n=1 Tax=Ixodes ricinus TaxID=34613 RepID=A0A6B0V935_IXORI